MRCRRWRLRLTANNLKSQNLTKPGSIPGFVVLVAPAGSYRITAYAQAAQALGLPLLVVSNSAHSLVADVADGITVNFADLGQAFDLILQALADRPVACVIATDDSGVVLCNRIADHYGLPHNSVDAAAATQRKDLGRNALAKAGCNRPSYQVIDLASANPAQLQIAYPLVVKPLSLSASRGVIRVDDDNEFNLACRRIDKILAAAGLQGITRERVLVESYIDGEEFAIEGFMIDGEFHLLTIFDKPERLTGPFFEETYYLTPTRLPVPRQRELIAEVAKCCLAYGLQHGPIHAEARLSSAGPMLLELAARTIGGQCGRLIEFSLQQKLEQLVIRGMCGLDLGTADPSRAAGVLMIPITTAGILKRVEGLTAALQTKYVEDVEIHINPGYELLPLPEGASYLGFIFAQGPDVETTYRALRSAHAKLRFITQPKWELTKQMP